MDMARTPTNVVGNCLATCVVARWEGEFTSMERPAHEALTLFPRRRSAGASSPDHRADEDHRAPLLTFLAPLLLTFVPAATRSR